MGKFIYLQLGNVNVTVDERMLGGLLVPDVAKKVWQNIRDSLVQNALQARNIFKKLQLLKPIVAQVPPLSDTGMSLPSDMIKKQDNPLPLIPKEEELTPVKVGIILEGIPLVGGLRGKK